MKRYVKSVSRYGYTTGTDEFLKKSDDQLKIYEEYENDILQETDCKKIGDIVDKALSDRRLPLFHQESIYKIGTNRCKELKHNS